MPVQPFKKGELPETTSRVRKSVITCILRESVKFRPILDRLVFASQFFSIRTILVLLENGQCFGVEPGCFIIGIFKCRY